METGLGFNGPLDNVKISAGPSWDGRVKQREESVAGIMQNVYHNGRYRWHHYSSKWVWYPSIEAATKTPRAGYANRKKP